MPIRLLSLGESAISADSSFRGDGGDVTAAHLGNPDAMKPSYQSDISSRALTSSPVLVDKRPSGWLNFDAKSAVGGAR